MKSALKKLTLISLAGLCSFASAKDLAAPIDLYSAKVLPTNVRNFRFKDLQIRGNTKYQGDGSRVDLSDPFFKTITFSDLIEIKGADPIEKGKLKGFLEARGFNLNDSVGSTTGALSVAAEARVPVLAWGITKKLTMAVAVPVVKYEFNTNTGFMASEEGRRLQAELKGSNRVFEANKLEDKLRDPVTTKLEDFNYRPLKNEKGSRLGDIKLVTKYQLAAEDKYLWALQNDITLPTGKTIDINKVVDVPGGDGQTDIGLTLINEYYPVQELTLSTAIGYTWQTPDKVARRVPYRQDSKLSPDVDNNVERNLGDITTFQAGAKYQWLFGLNLLTGYTFQYKNHDKFTGTKYNQERYDWLAIDSAQRMHTLTLGIGYNTIDLYRAKKFPIPFEVNIGHTRLMAGKNAKRDPMTTLEFSMYF